MSSNNPNRVYLDTETTGLHPEEGDEILSLTIVDANGRLLFDERFKPKHKKEWPEAQAVNHISPDDVEHLTTIDAYMEQICRILDRIADEIVGYNVAFDIGFLKAAGATINPDAVIIDTMQEFMDAFGNSNTGHRYQPLSMAAERLGYNWTSAPHGSLPDTLACLAAQKCVDDHNWCVENLELTEDAIMNAKPIENGSEGLPKDCWDLNPGGRPFAVTEPILHRLQSSAKLCARAGITTQFTRMTVNQWFDKAERSQRSPLGRSVDIGRAASALNSQHEHAEVPQDLINKQRRTNMDDYKKIPFDDPDLCVPDLDDFDQMKEFFLDCAAEYFRYLSSDDMEKMLAALGKRVDVLATPTDDVFISVSPDAVLRQYPDITIDEAIQIRDNACENIWESGGQSDLDEIVWDQIGAEYKSIKSDSHRGLSDVKDAKAKQAVHVNDDRENDAVALDMQEK